MQRLFYIIGHNPNTISEVEEFLKAGANGIEPDVHFDIAQHGKNDVFYISHGIVHEVSERLTLTMYLQSLRELLGQNKYKDKLALIAFDVKTLGFNVDQFVKRLDAEFMHTEEGRGVNILITYADNDIDFLRSYTGRHPNISVGIDFCNDPFKVLENARQIKSQNVSYGYGVFQRIPHLNNILNNILPPAVLPTDLLYPSQYRAISDAVGIRSMNYYFDFVYHWITSGEDELRRYFQLRVDAMIVDIEDIKSIKKMLKKEFAKFYTLGLRHQIPFVQRMPIYKLNIRTAISKIGVRDYGTDATLRFIIRGTTGTTAEAIIDASQKGMMEEGLMNSVVIEGTDVGIPKELVIIVDSSWKSKLGVATDWHIVSIDIQTNTSDWQRTLELNQTFKAGSSTALSL